MARVVGDQFQQCTVDHMAFSSVIDSPPFYTAPNRSLRIVIFPEGEQTADGFVVVVFADGLAKGFGN